MTSTDCNGGVRKKRNALSSSALICRVGALKEQLEQLSVRNRALHGTKEILEGLCAAGHLAAEFLKDMRSTVDIAMDIEKRVDSLLSGSHSPDAEGHRYSQWYPQESFKGCTSSLAATFFVREQLDGPIHASLLDGGVFSPLVCCLICLNADPEVREGVLGLLTTGPQSMAAKECIRVDASLSSSSQEQTGAADPPTDPILGSSFFAPAGLYLYTHLAGMTLLDPLLGIVGPMQNSQGDVLLPPPSRLDAVTEQLAMGEQQLQQLLDGLHIIQQLQEPLNREEASINATIQHLLLQESPSQLDDDYSSISAQAEAAVAMLAGLSGEVESDSEGASDGATSAAPPFPRHIPMPVRIEGPMSGLGSHSHQELLRSAERLDAIHYKLLWMDFCSALFSMGQLTWGQYSTFQAAMRPYAPSLILWSRRLVALSSNKSQGAGRDQRQQVTLQPPCSMSKP